MIAHETPGMELPSGFGAGFAQGGEEAATVEVIAKDRFAQVAAIHEVVDGSWKFSKLARHCQLLEPHDFMRSDGLRQLRRSIDY